MGARLLKLDKLGYRYPRGESYYDIIARLDDPIQHIETYRTSPDHLPPGGAASGVRVLQGHPSGGRHGDRDPAPHGDQVELRWDRRLLRGEPLLSWPDPRPDRRWATVFIVSFFFASAF